MTLGRRSDKPFYAPLWAGGAAAVLVIGVLIYTFTAGSRTPRVADLQTPAVAADQGGYESYPANSREAFVEDLKFGFVPVMDLMALADGTIVVADPASTDFPSELGDLSAEEFAGLAIPAAAEDQPEGTTLTWDEALEDFATAAVTIVTVEDPAIAGGVVDDIESADIAESIIVRSSEPDVISAAGEAGINALATPSDAPQDAAAAEALAAGGATMVEVPAEGFLEGDQATPALTALLEADLGVWVTGLGSADALEQAGAAGVTGAVTAAPYDLRPPST